MATLQILSTKGTPIAVVYPAERTNGLATHVRLRVGKKTMLPAYSAANLPHLVQFRVGGRQLMFMLSDILETAYWKKVRNAYNWRGQLDIDDEAKVGGSDVRRVIQWLKEQTADRGICVEKQADAHAGWEPACS